MSKQGLHRRLAVLEEQARLYAPSPRSPGTTSTGCCPTCLSAPIPEAELKEFVDAVAKGDCDAIARIFHLDRRTLPGFVPDVPKKSAPEEAAAAEKA